MFLVQFHHQRVVIHFHGDVAFYDAYAEFSYGGENRTIVVALWDDSRTAVTGGELWLTYTNTTYNVVVNCSLYQQPASLTLEPVIPQGVDLAYFGAVYATLINDFESEEEPHSHWFYFLGQLAVIKSEICASITFPIAMRIVSLSTSLTASNLCTQNNVFKFTYNRNFLEFSSGDSLTVTNAGEFQAVNFVFIGSISTTRTLVPIYNQVIFSYYGTGYLTNYGLYGVKAHNSLIIGNSGTRDTTDMAFYVYNKSLGFSNSACLIVRQGKKFMGKISNDTNSDSGTWRTNTIYAEDFFEKFDGNLLKDYYGAIVVSERSIWSMSFNVNNAEITSKTDVYIIIGLAVFGALCVIATTVLCVKARPRTLYESIPMQSTRRENKQEDSHKPILG